jgi:hypothetical protein
MPTLPEHISTTCSALNKVADHKDTCDVLLVQDCDDLVEVQVAARVERMREVEMAAARQEAAAKYVLEREREGGR